MTNGSAVALPYQTNTPGLALEMQNGQPFASQEQEKEKEIRARRRIRIFISKFKASQRDRVKRMSREEAEMERRSFLSRNKNETKRNETKQERLSERNTMSAHNWSKKAKETASFDLVFQNLNHAERFHLAIKNVPKQE